MQSHLITRVLNPFFTQSNEALRREKKQASPLPIGTKKDLISQPLIEPSPLQKEKALDPLEMTSEDFDRTLEETQKIIPTLQKLQTLSQEEIHHTPVLLLEAGKKLGEIAEILHVQPHFASQAISFYRTCARESQYPNSVRALCYSNLKQLDPQSFHNENEDPEVNEAVIRLAHQID
jgi:hypothetical protein